MAQYDKDKPVWKESWFIRRVVYALLAVALAVGIGFGIITESQADQITTSVDQVLAALAVVGLGVASAKTKRGSDDPTTVDDLVAVQPVVDVQAAVDTAVGDIRARIDEIAGQLAPPVSSDPVAGGTYPKGDA